MEMGVPSSQKKNDPRNIPSQNVRCRLNACNIHQLTNEVNAYAGRVCED
jgi:hypothetical protein